MWSFGSLRETLRENAKVAREKAMAAAEVAQGVLTAAAEEDVPPATSHRRDHLDDDGDDDYYANNNRELHHDDINRRPPSSDSDFDSWNAASQLQTAAPPPKHQQEPDDAPLPPPPEDDDPSFPPPPSLPPPSSGLMPLVVKPASRSSRYVVTGLQTTDASAAVTGTTPGTAIGYSAPIPTPNVVTAAIGATANAPTPSVACIMTPTVPPTTSLPSVPDPDSSAGSDPVTSHADQQPVTANVDADTLANSEQHKEDALFSNAFTTTNADTETPISESHPLHPQPPSQPTTDNPVTDNKTFPDQSTQAHTADDETKGWGFEDDDWDIPQDDANATGPVNTSDFDGVMAVPQTGEDTPRTTATTVKHEPIAVNDASAGLGHTLAAVSPGALANSDFAAVPSTQTEPSPSAFFDNPPSLPDSLKPLSDTQSVQEQNVIDESTDLDFSHVDISNESGDPAQNEYANEGDPYSVNQHVKGESELLNVFGTGNDEKDDHAASAGVNVDGDINLNLEVKEEPDFHIKPEPEILQDAFSDSQTDVKEPQLIEESFDERDDLKSEKDLEPQLIHIPKSESEFEPCGDDVAVDQNNIIADAFDLPESKEDEIVVPAFDVNETGKVTNGSDVLASNSNQLPRGETIPNDDVNNEPQGVQLDQSESVADAFASVEQTKKSMADGNIPGPLNDSGSNADENVMNSFDVPEADQNVSVANAFEFEITADQQTSQPQPWPIPAADVDDGEDKSVPDPVDEPIVEHTINDTQPTQSKGTEIGETEVHLEESKVSEAPSSWSADPSKPSASGQFSDDANWFAEDTAAAVPETDEILFSEEFEKVPQEDQPNDQPNPESYTALAADEVGQGQGDGDHPAQGIDSIVTKELPVETESDTTVEKPIDTEHTLNEQERESVSTAQTHETGPEFLARRQEPSAIVGRGKVSTHDEAGQDDFAVSNGLPESDPSQHGGDVNFYENNYGADTAWNASRVDADYNSTVAELASMKNELDSASCELHSRSQQLDMKQREVEQLCGERDSIMSRIDTSEKESNMLRETIDQLRREIASRDQELFNLSCRAEGLSNERDALIEERVIAERERDLAVERGGDGLREARSVIEELRNHRATAEVREAVMGEEVQEMRTQLDRVSAERNHLISQMDGLRNVMTDVQSESMNKCDELNKQIKIVETEAEIARFEREKVIDSSNELKEELRKVHEAEQERVVALARSESRVKELEMQLQSGDRFREEEAMRIEAFTGLVEEMKDRTRGIIEERNALYDEKVALESERDNFQNQLNQVNRKLLDVEREMKSLIAEREEWKQTCQSLREQMREASRRQEAISAERDQLLQNRVAQASVSEREKALALECEQKTRAVAVLQKKLTSASSKIDKLTVQRGTFQRQRDDAGMRLRAAGAEFLALNNKLEETTKSRDEIQRQMVSLRDDRDKALTKVQELSELKPKLNVLNESIEAKEKDIEQAWHLLHDEQRRNEKVVEEAAAAQQKCTTLGEQLKEAGAQVDVVSREKDLLKSRIGDFEAETARLIEELKQVKAEKSALEAKSKEDEAQRATAVEVADRDLAMVRAELAAEQKARALVEEKLVNVERDVIGRQTMEGDVRRSITAFVSSAQELVGVKLLIDSNRLNLVDIAQVLSSDNDPKVITQAVMKLCSTAQIAFDEFGRASSSVRQLEEQYSQSASQVEQYTYEIEQLRRFANESSQAEADVEAMRQRAENAEAGKAEQLGVVAQLRQELHVARQAESEARHQLQVVQDQMRREMDETARKWASENAVATSTAEHASSKLQSIWTMLQRAISAEQAKEIWEDADYNEENEFDKVAVAAFRATASMVAEIGRKRAEATDLTDKLRDSDAEVVRLIDRSEIAERERDALRGTVERVQRKADNAHDQGMEDARGQFEAIIQRLEDDLGEARDNVSRMTEKVSRSEKEAGELKALCSKLTTQLNGRTNELDQAEESLAYAQDQVASLEEDLQEAHRRLKIEGEESQQSRQNDVDRLTKELEEGRSQLERIETECVSLRARCDQAEKEAAESKLVARTHKQAEENLQIAIEQLEAAQQSAVVQRTFDLDRQVRQLTEQNAVAVRDAQSAQGLRDQLVLCDDEIRELRGAIGRLSDERVELKLELEKNLSRLNHPDAGGQLVDRRVVRQLLVSYFRVGSVRRRDVLQLMSRMLAFSDADNQAVGLTRRALMDRIGSFVQAPDVADDAAGAALPPIGTVSDKWIEFLMKETEEGEEEQEARW